MKYDTEKYEIAKRLYQEGKSLSTIQNEIGFERHKLAYLLKKDGVEIIQNGAKYDYRTDFFEKIDTEEKAYWLGFLYADGNVIDYGKYELKISLAYKDLEHVKKFAQTILLSGDADNLVKPYTAKLKGKEYPSAKVIIGNKKIVQDVIALNCVPNKSLILTFPSETIVPKELQRHFVRGYFDGDGCVYIPTSNKKVAAVSFIGTKQFLQSLIDIFNVVCKNPGQWSISQKTNQKAWQFSKAKYNACYDIYKYMYQDATIYLERKYERFVNKYGKL